MTVDAGALHEELARAGLKIRSVGSDGSIDWAGDPDPRELSIFRAVLAAHDPAARQRQWKADLVELRELRTAQDASVPPTIEAWDALTPGQQSAAVWRGLRIQSLDARAKPS